MTLLGDSAWLVESNDRPWLARYEGGPAGARVCGIKLRGDVSITCTVYLTFLEKVVTSDIKGNLKGDVSQST